MYKYKNGEQSNNLFSPCEGFIKGTMFKTLYEPYKNYKPEKITGSNEKERLMLEVQMYYAALHDLMLYLEVCPYDKEALRLRNEYYEKYMIAKKDYDEKESPYTWDAKFDGVEFTYATTPFQWEMKK